MCLTITVEVADLSEQELGSLARAVSTGELGFASQGRGLLRRHGPRLAAHGCELLAEDADWDAATWSMTDDGKRRLSAALGRLFQQTAGNVRFAAIFDGDRAETEEAISRRDLLEIVAAGELGTKTQYVIAGDDLG
jgi:hypothetical protein